MVGTPVSAGTSALAGAGASTLVGAAAGAVASTLAGAVASAHKTRWTRSTSRLE